MQPATSSDAAPCAHAADSHGRLCDNGGVRTNPAGLRSRFAGLRLAARMGVVAVTATALVLAGTAVLTLRFFGSQLREVASQASATESDALRIVLEEQMMAGDRHLLHRLVGDLGRAPGIEWVAVLDRDGRVRVSSDPAAEGRVFEKTSASCLVCHARPARERTRSATVAGEGGSLLRTVTPLLNRAPCQRCHGADVRFNGVLVVDRSLRPLQAALDSGSVQVLAGFAAAVLVLLASLGFAVDRMVLAPLRRMGGAARSLGRGDLAARARASSSDELGDLAREFNAMADRLQAAMASLAADRRQLDELVNGISDGVVLVDTALQVVNANRAFAARLPPGAAALPGLPYAYLARAAGVGDERVAAERALASGRLEKAIVRVAGAVPERVEEIYAQPLRGPDGEVAAVIEVWRDISQRTALEAGLEQSERLASIGVLASGVAHEVGNPLASILTAVEGLLRRLDEPAGPQLSDLRDYLEIIRKQVQRCSVVTRRLLGFARLPAGGRVVVDAAAAAREVLALVGPQARAQKVEVRTVLDAPVAAMAEDMALEQVLLNLVLNALQAMPEGGVLKVGAEADGAEIRVTVSDSGPGVPEAVRHRLFEPFRSAHASGRGTGLGLFLSRTLVERCGGRISVVSEPGRGAAFTVHLERARAGTSAAAALAKAGEGSA